MNYSTIFLNKLINVKTDRPLGSEHPKYDYYYPINYGYTPNTKAPDGAEVDAYILGVYKPLEQFSGKCIVVIHRLDDNDDKLIVVPEDIQYNNKQIKTLTEFQERFFKSEIIR